MSKIVEVGRWAHRWLVIQCSDRDLLEACTIRSLFQRRATRGQPAEHDVNLKLLARSWRTGTLFLGSIGLLAVGGCPIDSADVVTQTVQAGLEAIVASLVDSLSTYLAGT